MSGIEIDRDAASRMARSYRDSSEDLETTLGSLPASVDGGLASEVLADIVARAAEDAAHLAAAGRLIAAVIDATVSDVSATDESVSGTFSSVQMPTGADS